MAFSTKTLMSSSKLVGRIIGTMMLLSIGYKAITGYANYALENHIAGCRGAGTAVAGATALQKTKAVAACVSNAATLPEKIMFSDTAAMLNAMPNSPCQYVGVWTSTRPGSVYRITLGDQGNFKTEIVSGEAPYGQASSKGSWGVWKGRMAWFYPDINVFPPDNNPIVDEEADRFTLIEQNGIRTQFTRLYAIDSRICGTTGIKVSWGDDSHVDTPEEIKRAQEELDTSGLLPHRLKAPDLQEWAGDYAAPAPTAEASLTIGKDGQYTGSASCASADAAKAPPSSDAGIVRVDDEWYNLIADAASKAHECRLPSRLFPLALDGTRYLLSEARLSDLVNQLNAGQPVAVDALLQAKTGKPGSVAQWQPKILATLLPKPYGEGIRSTPLQANLTGLSTVGATSALALMHPQAGGEVEYGSKATLGAGSRDGVFPGMQLYLAGGPAGLKIWVEEVMLEKAKVRLVWKGSWRPSEGSLVSTSPPAAK